MTKRISIVCCFLFSTITFSFSQQISSFSHFNFVPEYFNPARTGSGLIGVNYKNQWMGIEDGAPLYYLLNADLSSLIGVRSKRIGLGVNLNGDKAHIFKRTGAGINFSYYLLDLPTQRLSIGINAGLLNQGIDFMATRLNDPATLTIFDGDESKSIFNGGGGINWFMSVSDQHVVELDLSMPQLFSSNIEYSSGAVSEMQSFFLFRGSYKYNTSNFGIEPILFYRGAIGGKKIKAGNIDVGGRLFFLNNLFWFGGNYRLNAQATSFHFGINPDPAKKISIIGGYEISNLFGGSLEFGIGYNFSGEGAYPGLNKNRREIERILANTEKFYNLTKKDISQIQKSLASARRKGISPSEKDRRLEAAKRDLNSLSMDFRNITNNGERINTITIETENKYRSEFDLSKNNDFKKIRAAQNKIENWNTEINSRINVFNNELTKLEQKDQVVLETPSQLAKLESELKSRLESKSMSKNVLDARVFQNADKSVVVKYRFYHGAEDYSFVGNPDFQRFVEHFIVEIQNLEKQGIKIGSINLVGDLRYSLRSWKLPSGRYNGEFGSSLTIPYKKLNKSTSMVEEKNLSIRTGGINVEKLAAIKLHALKSEIQKRMPGKSVELKLTGPNSTQTKSQIYSIEFNVGK